MLDTLMTMCYLFGTYYADIIPMVVIMVSAIIVVIGFLKPFTFDKIKNKEMRRAALALTNIGANFLATLFYFLGKGWNFKYYVLASIAMTFCTIITYYIYETVPGARNFIGGLGKSAIYKVFNVGLIAVTTDDANTVKDEIKNATVQLKATTKQELKKTASAIKVDKDLKGL